MAAVLLSMSAKNIPQNSLILTLLTCVIKKAAKKLSIIRKEYLKHVLKRKTEKMFTKIIKRFVFSFNQRPEEVTKARRYTTKY